MIKPTIGRRVWYWPPVNTGSAGFTYNDPAQPLDAGIAYVHGDRLINISVADQNGVVHSRTGVPLLQEGDARPVDALGKDVGGFCEWMPYQVGQAKSNASS